MGLGDFTRTVDAGFVIIFVEELGKYKAYSDRQVNQKFYFNQDIL